MRHGRNRYARSLSWLALGLIPSLGPPARPARGGDAKILGGLAPPPPPSDYRAKYAIVVGVDRYAEGSGFVPLQNAVNDAREFRDLLVGDFGYEPGRILYLTDAQATRE